MRRKTKSIRPKLESLEDRLCPAAASALQEVQGEWAAPTDDVLNSSGEVGQEAVAVSGDSSVYDLPLAADGTPYVGDAGSDSEANAEIVEAVADESTSEVDAA